MIITFNTGEVNDAVSSLNPFQSQFHYFYQEKWHSNLLPLETLGAIRKGELQRLTLNYNSLLCWVIIKGY